MCAGRPVTVDDVRPPIAMSARLSSSSAASPFRSGASRCCGRGAEIGVGPDEPVFGTIDGGFREPRTVSRWLHEVRADSDLEWVTSHAWRKTTASILDGSGVTARMIADQLGHSRVSMTQDVYLGRGEQDPRVLAALEAANPRPPSLPQSGGESGGLDDVGGGD